MEDQNERYERLIKNLDVHKFIKAKQYLLNRFNSVYTNETIKNHVLVLFEWIDYLDYLIKSQDREIQDLKQQLQDLLYKEEN